MWLHFTFVCRLLFMNHTNNFFCAVFIPNLWNIVNLNLKVAQFALMYTDLHKDEWVLCVQRNHSPHLFIEGWKLNKKNKKKSRFPQWLGSVAIIQRRDYYYHYFIFYYYYWLGGGLCLCLCIFLYWWIDKGISPKCLFLHLTQHFLHVSEKPYFHESVYKRIRFIVPAEYSPELKYIFIMYFIEVGFTENADKKVSIDNIRIEYKWWGKIRNIQRAPNDASSWIHGKHF